MREILFRGKRTDNGEWVYGSLVYWPGDNKIGTIVVFEGIDEAGFVFGEHVEVDLNTVSQYTGMTDKNGMKIFEGDIISTRKNAMRTEKLKGYYGVDSDGYPQKIPGYKGECEYHYSCQVDCHAQVKFSPRGGYYLCWTSMSVNAICNEVVGNIYDNPELLYVENKESKDENTNRTAEHFV